MLTIIKNPVKLLLVLFGLFFFNNSQAYKNNLTRPIVGVEGTDELIKQGSELFSANCASCHALKGKVVGPALEGVIDKYEEDYAWLNAWIKNSQKLVKSGDERAVAIYLSSPDTANSVTRQFFIPFLQQAQQQVAPHIEIPADFGNHEGEEDEEDEAMTDTIENTGDENQEATENETTE